MHTNTHTLATSQCGASGSRVPGFLVATGSGARSHHTGPRVGQFSSQAESLEPFIARQLGLGWKLSLCLPRPEGHS